MSAELVALSKCSVGRTGLEYFPFDDHEAKLTIIPDNTKSGSGFVVAMQHAESTLSENSDGLYARMLKQHGHGIPYMSPNFTSRDLFKSHKWHGLPASVKSSKTLFSEKWHARGCYTKVDGSGMSAVIVLKVVIGRDKGVSGVENLRCMYVPVSGVPVF